MLIPQEAVVLRPVTAFVDGSKTY